MIKEFKILTDILLGSILSHSTEPDYVFSINSGWHHVNFARCVYITQKLLINLIRAFQAKTNQTQYNFIANLKSLVFQHQLFEDLGQMNVMSNVLL